MKKTSIQDIADELGVSKALVSFVLNGKGREKRISQEMCKKVFKTAEKLNYRPNQIARWFRTGKTQTIGLIIADISNPFFGKLGREIEKEAYNAGYRLVLCSSDENAGKSKQQIDMLLQNQVDGFIIAPPQGSEDQIEMLNMAKVPYVLIDRYFPDVDSNYVVIDNYNAAYEATNYLIKKGYKKIALMAVNDELITIHDRSEGYLQSLKDAGIIPEDKYIYKLPFSHNKLDVEKAVQQIIRSKEVDAILFASSKIGVMGMELMVDMNVAIPDDIAIVSFDDPDFYKVCISPVTAIAQPLEEMGKTAVNILIDEIKSENPDLPSIKVVLNSKFILRKSSGI